MKIIDYLRGRPVILRSPLPVQEVRDRINRASKSRWWPFNEGVVGGVSFSGLRLEYREFPLFSYNAAPQLAGRLSAVAGGTEFSLKFGAPPWTYFFFAFWYLFLALVTSLLVVAWINNDTGLDQEAFPFAMLLLAAFLVLPVLMHILFTRNSDQDLAELVNFLEKEAEASLFTRLNS